MNIDIKLLKHQKRFIESKSNKILLLAGRATGKSYIASIIAAISIIQNKRIIVLAQTFSALQRNLFAEIVNRLDEWHVNYSYNKASMAISSNNGVAYGYSYENIESIRGLSDISVCIADEIALAPPPESFFATVSPIMRGKNIIPKFYAMTTPRAGSAWNEVFKTDNTWEIITATTFDNTFLSKESIDLMKESLSEEMKRQELYGDMLDLVVENAICDIDEVPYQTSYRDDEYYCGIDFARYGNDETAICIRNGYSIVEMVKLANADTDAIVDKYLSLYSIYRPVMTAIDSTGGYDIGFYDRLKNTHKEIVEVNFGSSSPDTICANNRAYIYMNLANALANGFAVNDNEIRRALRYTSWMLTNNGKRQLIPKDKIKAIIGCSPDTTDALALSFYKPGKKYSMNRSRPNEAINFLFR